MCNEYYVGYLIVEVDVVGNQATITYDMIDGEFFLEQVHLYVGETKLVPKGNGLTVAPGQYPLTDDNLADLDNFTYSIDLSTIDGTPNNSFWLIAHSVVSGMY